MTARGRMHRLRRGAGDDDDVWDAGRLERPQDAREKSVGGIRKRQSCFRPPHTRRGAGREDYAAKHAMIIAQVCPWWWRFAPDSLRFPPGKQAREAERILDFP